MGHVAVIGEAALVTGYTLAGADVVPADDAQAVERAWQGLGDDVEVVVLTPRAAAVLGVRRSTDTLPLTVVMPT